MIKESGIRWYIHIYTYIIARVSMDLHLRRCLVENAIIDIGRHRVVRVVNEPFKGPPTEKVRVPVNFSRFIITSDPRPLA